MSRDRSIGSSIERSFMRMTMSRTEEIYTLRKRHVMRKRVEKRQTDHIGLS